MKWFIVILLGVSAQLSAETCPRIAGLWAGTCNGNAIRIFLMQEDCSKFIYNEFEQREDGTMGPGSRFYTLDHATLYKKQVSADLVNVAYRLAELDSTFTKLTLHETRYFENKLPVEVRKTTFIFNSDKTLHFAYESFDLTGQKMTNSYSCSKLEKYK